LLSVPKVERVAVRNYRINAIATVIAFLLISIYTPSARAMLPKELSPADAIHEIQYTASRDAWGRMGAGGKLTPDAVNEVITKAMDKSQKFQALKQEVVVAQGRRADQAFLAGKPNAQAIADYITALLVAFVDADEKGEQRIRDRIHTIDKGHTSDWDKTIQDIKKAKTNIIEPGRWLSQSDIDEYITQVGVKDVCDKLDQMLIQKNKADILKKINAALNRLDYLDNASTIKQRASDNQQEISRLLEDLRQMPENSAVQQQVDDAIQKHDLQIKKEISDLVAPIATIFTQFSAKSFKDIATQLQKSDLADIRQKVDRLAPQVITPDIIDAITGALYWGLIILKLNEKMEATSYSSFESEVGWMRGNVGEWLKKIPQHSKELEQATKAIEEHDECIKKEIDATFKPILEIFNADKDKEFTKIAARFNEKEPKINVAKSEKLIDELLQQIISEKVHKQAQERIQSEFVGILSWGKIIQILDGGIDSSTYSRGRDRIIDYTKKISHAPDVLRCTEKAIKEYDQSLLEKVKTSAVKSFYQKFFDKNKENLAWIWSKLAYHDKDGVDKVSIRHALDAIEDKDIRTEAEQEISRHDQPFLEKIRLAYASPYKLSAYEVSRKKDPEQLKKAHIAELEKQLILPASIQQAKDMGYLDTITQELKKGAGVDIDQLRKCLKEISPEAVKKSPEAQQAHALVAKADEAAARAKEKEAADEHAAKIARGQESLLKKLRDIIADKPVWSYYSIQQSEKLEESDFPDAYARRARIKELLALITDPLMHQQALDAIAQNDKQLDTEIAAELVNIKTTQFSAFMIKNEIKRALTTFRDLLTQIADSDTYRQKIADLNQQLSTTLCKKIVERFKNGNLSSKDAQGLLDEYASADFDQQKSAKETVAESDGKQWLDRITHELRPDADQQQLEWFLETRSTAEACEQDALKRQQEIKKLQDEISEIARSLHSQAQQQIATHDQLILARIREKLAGNRMFSDIVNLPFLMIDKDTRELARNVVADALKAAAEAPPPADECGRIQVSSLDDVYLWKQLQKLVNAWRPIDEIRQVIAASPTKRTFEESINLYDINDPDKTTAWITAVLEGPSNMVEFFMSYLNQAAKNVALVKTTDLPPDARKHAGYTILKNGADAVGALQLAPDGNTKRILQETCIYAFHFTIIDGILKTVQSLCAAVTAKLLPIDATKIGELERSVWINKTSEKAAVYDEILRLIGLLRHEAPAPAGPHFPPPAPKPAAPKPEQKAPPKPAPAAPKPEPKAPPKPAVPPAAPKAAPMPAPEPKTREELEEVQTTQRWLIDIGRFPGLLKSALDSGSHRKAARLAENFCSRFKSLELRLASIEIPDCAKVGISDELGRLRAWAKSFNNNKELMDAIANYNRELREGGQEQKLFTWIGLEEEEKEEEKYE
jgi:hypothetical protein